MLIIDYKILQLKIMPEILALDIKNKNSARSETSFLGEFGERLAAQFLEKQGFRLVLANFKTPVGRNSLGAVVKHIDP